MRTYPCAREQEVVASVVARGAADDDEDLRAHVSECEACQAVFDLALMLRADRDVARAEPNLPSSAVVWWRAQLRARQEAARQAERPIAAALSVTFVSIVALVVAMAPMASGWLHKSAPPLARWLPNISLPAFDAHLPFDSIALVTPMSAAMLVGTVTLLILAPVAMYLTRGDH